MTVKQALSRIETRLKAAAAEGIEPTVRASGNDWVCTIEEEQSKFVIVVKENELMIVTLESHAGKPDIWRIHASDFSQGQIIARIKKAMKKEQA